jgi:hypothetical protein
MKRTTAALLALALTGGPAMAANFTTRQEAMDYIARTLPTATAANPTYTTRADGTVSQWLTEGVAFETGANGAVSVTMRERYTQEKAGKTTPGRHEARFCFADVAVTDFTEPGDVTPSGEPSRGILFTCRKPKCIGAIWGDTASLADKTDISIQDATTRETLLAAFRRLQSP